LEKQKLRFWNIPVPELLDNSLEKAVRQKTYVSKADFVRDAVRHKLEEMDIQEKTIIT
jgi:Arc/MetJ-type ribon-helix-helix transcriptional regulator